MLSMVAGEVPDRGAKPLPPNSSRGHVVTMVEFRGLLPSQPAHFLGHLSDFEKRDVYALLGTYQEVRGLVGAGRLLHAYLKEGPLAAARGRTTFREFLDQKDEILRDIFALREKINRAAENVCLILPRIPQLRIQEVSRDQASRRVS
jgi:hypothetical protein